MPFSSCRNSLRHSLLILFLFASPLALPTVASAQTPAPSNSTATVQGFQLSPGKRAEAISYRHKTYWLYAITTLYTAFLLVLFLRLRVAPRLRNWAERVSSRRFVQLLLFAPPLILLFVLLLSPTDVYSQWLSLRYGQSVQSWGSWMRDWTQIQILVALFGAILVGVLFWALRRSPRRWWFYFWAAAVPIFFFAVFLEPLLIDPLFYEYEPLEKTHPELVATIDKLLAHAGLPIPHSHIFLMKASVKTNSLDAYVTGFGASKRLVLFDTIIAAERGDVILHTLGHEMGHYVLNHEWISFAVFAPAFLGVLYAVYRIFLWSLARWGPALDIRSASDWAALPLLLLIIFVLTFLLTPVSNGFSRWEEHEADRYGLEVIHGVTPNPGEVASQAFQLEGETNLADPAPPEFVRIWLFDHPPTNDRIIFCRTYNPWSPGQKPKYVQ
ncbi:MAG TPA: M48 family metalloprotease [Candidatus Acidoferrum sp.]|nr:M48 family metalloprotease [Candidatus Acidoferrum sp.]